MNLSVLGCGRWGSFIAYYLSDKHDVMLWGRENGTTFSTLKEKRANTYLTLPDNIKLTSSLREALEADIIIISILTQELRGFLKEVVDILQDNLKKKKFVFCMKGVDSETGQTLTQIAMSVGIDKNALALWVGPGHVENFLSGISNCMLISAYDKEYSKMLSQQFSSKLIRFYLSDDVLGAEIGSASKNVVGIASGILDGLGYQCLKGALMTRATNEVSKLIVAMGGEQTTVYGLAHLGDYEATLFSPFSHNRSYGEMLARGEKYDKSAEGVGNTKGIAHLGKKYNIDMPITYALERVLFENADIEEEIDKLFEREQKYEF